MTSEIGAPRTFDLTASSATDAFTGMPDATAVGGDPQAEGAIPERRKHSKKRKRIKRSTIFVHRWSSLVLGIVLLVITTSGALVVYSPEWLKWTNSSVFHTTQSDRPVSTTQAIDIVNDAHPGWEAANVNVYSGLYEVSSANEDHHGFYGVDPGSGNITGFANPESGFMAFMNQIHECFFTCDDYPGYLSFLNDHVPTLGMKWLKDMTWGSFILGMAALLLLFLAVSGIWLWWPGVKKWTHGFRVRMHKGRYARDYDLHQVIGMAAVPFLLIWGLTGASFEFNWVKTAWYATTGGQTPADESFTSKEGVKAPDIGMAAAADAAQLKAGRTATMVYAGAPDAKDETSVYSFYFAKGFDQYQHGAYPGQYGVDVDRHDATRLHVNDYGKASSLSNQLLDNLGAPMFHYGQSVNAWWRIPWLLFGLTPLLLAATGISTWLAKRSVRKRRKQAQLSNSE